MTPMNFEMFAQRAMEQGALSAKVIEPGSIVTAPWVRLKCQFGCGRYGKSYCCPPKTPTPTEMQSVIDCYTKGLLIHCRGKANPTKIVVKLEKEIFLSGYYKALGLGAGPCRLCKECAEAGCQHSELARPAMEACGIDVYPNVAKILIMPRYKIKLRAASQPYQYRQMEFIVGSVFDAAAKLSQSRMNKGIMKHCIENFCNVRVYATAHNNDYPIEVLKDKSCEGNYFGLVLIE